MLLSRNENCDATGGDATGAAASARVHDQFLGDRHLVRSGLIEVATAVAIGVAAYTVAGRFRVPSLVVVVSGITPLLPGLSIYKGISLLAAGGNAGLLSLATALATALAGKRSLRLTAVLKLMRPA